MDTTPRKIDAAGASQTFIERVESLSPRQREVFERIRCGKSSKAIAGELGVSIKTVETHRSHINRRLGTNSVVELILACIDAGVGGSGSYFSKRSKGPDGCAAVDVEASIYVPRDWDESQTAGWVATQLHFPTREEQVHPEGPLLPYISTIKTSVVRQPGDRDIAFLDFAGRLDKDDPTGVVRGVELASASAPGLPEDGLAVRGSQYPLKHLLEAFAGKRVLISVKALPEEA